MGIGKRYHYQVGDATRLPFEDGSFDFVTCQTVLIHLPDSRAGLREMLRVLMPGGVLLLAEPNNFANGAVASNLTLSLSVDEVIDRMRFDLLIQRGKKALGLGNNSEGDLLPGYLNELGAQGIQVFLSDKAVPYFAPYGTPEQKANVSQIQEWSAREFVGWDREEMRTYYLAGGGEPERFEAYWKRGLDDLRATAQAISSGEFHSAGGGMMYLIAARKSSQ
jgi:SAM-dependent methyltransferase